MFLILSTSAPGGRRGVCEGELGRGGKAQKTRAAREGKEEEEGNACMQAQVVNAEGRRAGGK